MNQFQKKLLELANTTNTRWLEREVRKHSDLVQFIEDYWKDEWGKSSNFLEKMWHAVYQKTPICDNGNRLGFLSWKDGSVFCKKQCACFQNKKKETMIERYGVEHALQNTELYNKAKSVWKEKYGVDKLSDINVEQKQQTNIERYGSKTPLENNAIRQKSIDSLVKSYGTETPFQSTIIQERIKNEWMERTGKKGFARSKECLYKQNVELIKKTLSDKADYVLDKTLFTETLRKMSRIEMANFVGCSASLIDKRIAEWELVEFQQETSHYETVISKFLDDNGVEYILRDKKIIAPKEIDWLLPSHKLGIEFCGIRWHGERVGRGRQYHVQKLESMLKQGFNLIQIYQDEWDKNSKLIKDIILHKIASSSSIKIYARKCKIVPVNQLLYNEFMETNHIQGGNVGNSVSIGLEYDGLIVAMAGFRKNKKYQWEVSRYTNKYGYQVIGGFGKLFSDFCKNTNPDMVVSYADRRYFDGNSLTHQGFVFKGNTHPGYFYTKGVTRSHRSNHSKKVLISKGFDPLLTADQIMKNRGYYILWDCGNARWIWEKR